MNAIFVAFASGLLFGFGLIISGMSNPAKVLNFLDFTGAWDPSLAFVMASAVLVTAVGYRFILKRTSPILANGFSVPARGDIDRRLVSGAAVFGLGWGLGGFCPGPALTALPLGEAGTLTFVPSMLAGMWLARIAPNRSSAPHSS